MTIDDRSRHELFQRLDEVLGPDAAGVLMSHLPPVGWADVATKRDLDALEERTNLRFDKVEERFLGRLTAEIGGVRQELTAEIGRLRQDLAEGLGGVRQDLAEGLGGVRQDLAERTGGIRQEIGGLQAEFANQTRQIVFAMIGLIFTAVLLTYTAARFG